MWSSAWAGSAPGAPADPSATAIPQAAWTRLSKPRRPAHGPRCPQAESVTTTSPGCRSASASGASPNRSSAPGR